MTNLLDILTAESPTAAFFATIGHTITFSVPRVDSGLVAISSMAPKFIDLLEAARSHGVLVRRSRLIEDR
jgi:hypothetical protein